jgi:hypothetical protein
LQVDLLFFVIQTEPDRFVSARALTAGEQRVFALESLSSDPVFVKLAGGAVPGLDAVYRDLNRFKSEDVDKLHSLMVEHGLALVRSLYGSAEVHLDIDSTVEVVFGELRGASVGYNPKYRGRLSYHPLVARCAETRSWVGAQFRPGNTSFGENDAQFVGSCIDSMRLAVGPETVVYVRYRLCGRLRLDHESHPRKRCVLCYQSKDEH